MGVLLNVEIFAARHRGTTAAWRRRGVSYPGQPIGREQSRGPRRFKFRVRRGSRAPCRASRHGPSVGLSPCKVYER
jgi:hypothetical protein